MAVTKNKIEKNLARIRENIARHCDIVRRDPAEVSIVAVTKSIDLETIKNLLDAGVTELGESRIQHLTERQAEVSAYVQRRQNPLPAPVRWHMVGHLQRNKARAACQAAEVIHSIDSLRLAEEVNARAEKLGKVMDVMLQVNCSQEMQKHGCAVGAALHLGDMMTTLNSVRLVGLMTMARLSNDLNEARHSFSRLRDIFEDMHKDKIGGDGFRHLSMGMSNDYTVAVEEGATLLRIGSALFE
ncbi:MAG: YggS family pyridoxal phosphate-dependent enzyme [Planctomycetota bacterium]